MTEVRWKITLEVAVEQSPTRDTERTTLTLSGHWANDEQQRSPDECIALDMAATIQMLQSSGRLIETPRDESDAEAVIRAFTDNWS